MQAPQPAFRLLGPLEVWADGAPLRLGGERQRALLALLLLHANEVVQSDRLIDEHFRPDASGSANALQVAISRLRRLLGDGTLVTRPRGYLLLVEPGRLDSTLFEELHDDGRRALADGDAAGAAAKLREGLALWRGPPLADLAPLEAVRPGIRRLEELRLAALMDRLDADLALGRGVELVPELEGLVDANPLQERLRGQLMLALYRAGRQADALEAYRRTRELLRDELGLEPGAGLQQLQRQILNHDPALDPSANGDRPAVEPPPALPRSRRRSRTAWIAAACAALLVIAAGALATGRAVGSKHGLPAVDADGIGVLDPDHGRITAQLPLGARPVGVAVESRALWVAASDGTVSRIDPDRLGAFDTIPLGGNPGAITAGAGAIWVADQDTGMVARIDPILRRPVQTIRVGNGPSAAVFCAGSVWIANQTDGTLSRIDPGKGATEPPIPVGSAPTAVACGSGSVWVSDVQDGTVTRVNPQTNLVVKAIPVGAGPSAIAAGLGAVWVGSSLEGTVLRIDPDTNGLTSIPVGRSVDALLVHDGSVWAGDPASGTVARIDPAGGRVVQRVRVGSSPASLVTAGDRLIVATRASPASHHGGTLVIAGTDGGKGSFPVTLDPATWWSTLGWNLLTATNDGLVTYRRAGGPAGLVVVPDLAGSLPIVARGGTVQTFVLRPGLRYSDGRPVRARDVRASIERLWRMNAEVTRYPDSRLGLVGESACVVERRHCDLSRGILTDDLARTVSFHLARPNPFFLRWLALPMFDVLPAGTPPRDGRVLPATGPYRIVRYERGRLVVLERNRRFRVWSTAAQPPGFPDRIVARLALPPGRGLDEVLAGRADYLASSPPTERLPELFTRHASQVHALQAQGFRYLFLNTSIPPFDRRDARRALNYAVNRLEMVRLHGGPLAARPTCQVITPGFPGYRSNCPYTVRPSADGTWIGPDLDTARALVRRSGTSGAKVVVWAEARKDFRSLAIARSVARTLRDLGYRASVATHGAHDRYYDYVLDPRSRVQVGLAGWLPDFPATVGLIRPLIGCRAPANGAQLCDARLEELFRRAASLEATDKADANRVWTAIDHRIVSEAPWVPLVNFQWTDVVSRRLGNYQATPPPALGFLVDQAWVR